jgi:hypothetical protein
MTDTPLVHLNAAEAAIARANGHTVYSFNLGPQEFSTLDWNKPVNPVTPPPTVVPHAPVAVGTLLLNEDFSTQTSLDTSLWSPDWWSPTGNMNGVTTDPKNVSVVNGQLVLTLASATDGATVSTDPGAGAGNGFLFTYGYVEASIVFPESGGELANWCAFWTECQDWQNGEEFDIAETLAGKMTSNYHSRTNGVDAGQNSPAIAGIWLGKHTYGMLWKPGLQTMYFDGVEVYSRVVSTSGKPEYLIFTHGNGQGGPLVIGAKMIVDYVRVWSLAA